MWLLVPLCAMGVLYALILDRARNNLIDDIGFAVEVRMRRLKAELLDDLRDEVRRGGE